MTDIRRCAWCGVPFTLSDSGRPRTYCRRSHRQRAYEARQEGRRRRLAPGEAVVALGDLADLGDRLYVLSTALTDAEGDLGEGGDFGAAYRHVVEAAREVIAVRVEPRAVGGG